MARRSFGNTRRRDSGRWQARYQGPDGRLRTAPHTFESKKAAERWLTLVESEMLRGDWTDPERAKVLFGDYIERWIEQRAGLRDRTKELYSWLLRKHIAPHLGEVSLGKLSPADIRQWRADRLAAGVSESMAAKSYRLMRSVLNTAVNEDQIISANPCRIRGADKENPGERPVLSVRQVSELADSMPDRFRALVLLAAFGSLRWGEVSALRRCDVAPDGSWVRVSRAFVELPRKGLVAGPPKSRAGAREVIIPAAIRPDVVAHLQEFVDRNPEALLFTGERSGKGVRRSNFTQQVKWTALVTELGMKGVHFHDLRHAGNIWASKSGTSTADLMARMGHDDVRAALIYQRATREADERIADALSALVLKDRDSPNGPSIQGGSTCPPGN